MSVANKNVTDLPLNQECNEALRHVRKIRRIIDENHGEWIKWENLKGMYFSGGPDFVHVMELHDEINATMERIVDAIIKTEDLKLARNFYKRMPCCISSGKLGVHIRLLKEDLKAERKARKK